MQKETNSIHKYILVAFFLTLVYLAFLVAKPYINTILTAIVLAFLCYPLYERINAKIKRKSISAGIMIVLVLIVIIVPSFFLAKSIIQDAIQLYNSGIIDKAAAWVTNIIGENQEIKNLLAQGSKRAVTYLAEHISSFFISLTTSILNAIIGIFILYYLLISGKDIVEFMKKNLPIKNKEHMIKHLGDATFSMIYGIFLTAIIQITLAAIGFKLSGINSPILWAVVIGILAFIPFAGSAVVWIPMMVLKIVTENYPQAIGVLITGLIISSVETFLRPKLAGKRANIHPVYVLIGALGGVGVFGIIGLVIGPIVLSAVAIIFRDYMEKQ